MLSHATHLLSLPNDVAWSTALLPHVCLVLVTLRDVETSVPLEDVPPEAAFMLETVSPPAPKDKPTPLPKYSAFIRSNFNWKPLPYASFKLGKTAGKADGSYYDNPVYIPLVGDGDWNVTSNDPDVEIRRPSNADLWKTKVIIACTVTATLEILIVVVIVVYWKQIRWSLRKISCPCDQTEASDSHRRHRRRRRHRGGQQHQAMTRTLQHADSDSSSENIHPLRPHDPGIEEDELEYQTYAMPSTSRQVQTYTVLPSQDIETYPVPSTSRECQTYSVGPSTSRGTGSQFRGQSQAYIISALRHMQDNSDSESDEEMSITIHTTGV